MAGKTEWEDALIRHGIMAAPEVKPTDDELALKYIQSQEGVVRLLLSFSLFLCVAFAGSA